MSDVEKPRRTKERLDVLLIQRELVESRERARRLIMAGEVFVNDQVSDKPGKNVPVDAEIRIRAPLPYVSRGGIKLAAALDEFRLDVSGLVALDVGASTGGFTDCLLQRNAAKVYAVDVGYGQLAWKLRNDERVVVMERTNIRHLAQLPGSALADLAVIDASFIGLSLVLPPVIGLLAAEAQIIALIKPQFEAGRESVTKGGVVRDARVHRRVLRRTIALAQSLDMSVAGLTVSPLLGPAGNIEFLIWLTQADGIDVDLENIVEYALERANAMHTSGRGSH
jgi:23S rRNA (cytidine1920-2'-O)/16S rRNA (cytidine1409-2'-O)-methyltransferase